MALDVGSVIAAIAAIGILIMLHEAGHYFIAKRAGMRVRKFSLGFGPSLAKIERGGTQFQIAAIPFGGFVQIDGMSPHDGSDPNAPDSYANKPVHLRVATLFGGPAANYLAGFVLLYLFYAFFATEELAPVRVAALVPGGAAEQAGLQVDDLIIGTSSAAFDRADELVKSLQVTKEQPVTLDVERGGRKMKIVLSPRQEDGVYRIGIQLAPTRFRDRELGWGGAFTAAWERTWKVSGMVLQALGGLFRGIFSNVAGPIEMVRALSVSMKASIANAMSFVADISIMLGMFNLLPVPSLDGSRLMFLIVGLIRRKPVNAKVESIVHGVGFILLLLLILIVSIGDVRRL